jgi:transposase InsO family protein
MVKPLHPIALFRYGILGTLVTREKLAAGELKAMLQHLANQTYYTPEGKSARYSYKAIERWYYAFRRDGVEALTPKSREDHGRSQIAKNIQDILLEAKREKPSRSIKTLMLLIEQQGLVGRGELSRSSVHRLLARHGLSKRTVADGPHIERRSFEAQHAGEIWYGDVMHGIRVNTVKGIRKTYLVTYMDDASRLICHSSFYLSESTTEIEHALKEALLKRGLPQKLVIDNGAAYRAKTLQTICARLHIKLVYCRPYEPEGKGKLERWHRVVRETFLPELNATTLQTLDELNDWLWSWIEEGYHQQAHNSLTDQVTPLTRWRQDLPHIRPLGHFAKNLDHYFYHRVKRTIRKDGTLSYEGQYYEVPYHLANQMVYLVIDPNLKQAKWIESLNYEMLGQVHLLDKHANNQRQRQRPSLDTTQAGQQASMNLIKTFYKNRCKKLDITTKEEN